MKFKLVGILTLILSFVSCGSPSAEKIASDWCECKAVEKHQGNLQGEQCFQEWKRKYGDLRFNEAQKQLFNKKVAECISSN